MKVQSLTELEAEMRAVARGKIPAPKDAALPSAPHEDDADQPALRPREE
jgi:hypothetical protein